MGPPYGVVGPDSLNGNILVHDFTHRLHMDIFGGNYYPPSLTDWSEMFFGTRPFIFGSVDLFLVFFGFDVFVG